MILQQSLQPSALVLDPASEPVSTSNGDGGVRRGESDDWCWAVGGCEEGCGYGCGGGGLLGRDRGGVVVEASCQCDGGCLGLGELDRT